jgi:parallel beta-helix repeat protein
MQKSSLVVLALALLLGLLAGRPATVRADSFVVNSSWDDSSAHDWLPGDGQCADVLSRCTLRAAIEEANDYPGPDVITFDSSRQIYLDTTEGALPVITEQLRIDASNVWDTANDRPGVWLHGGDKSFSGLFLWADNCEVYGLYLINFHDAVDIHAAYNTVGGPLQGQRNVISSNGGYGVSISGSAAHHNVVWGNWIGLSITGDSKQPNFGGVRIAGGTYENTIGGDILGEGNVISGNTHEGIVIQDANSDGNRLGANLIGPPAVGTAQNVGNGGPGVYVSGGPRNTYIGSTGGDLAGNLIAFNGNAGVIIWGAHSNWVESNVIVQNGAGGVYVRDSAGNTILSNEIAYNAQTGVHVEGVTATGNPILANSIHHNSYQGIHLVDGGNIELKAPEITMADASGASGTGCANCTVHLFSDSEDEGEIYEGFANADANGDWTFSGPLTGPNVTATNTDAGANTSEFSEPFAIGGANPRVFLPFVTRNG